MSPSHPNIFLHSGCGHCLCSSWTEQCPGTGRLWTLETTRQKPSLLPVTYFFDPRSLQVAPRSLGGHVVVGRGVGGRVFALVVRVTIAFFYGSKHSPINTDRQQNTEQGLFSPTPVNPRLFLQSPSCPPPLFALSCTCEAIPSLDSMGIVTEAFTVICEIIPPVHVGCVLKSCQACSVERPCRKGTAVSQMCCDWRKEEFHQL